MRVGSWLLAMVVMGCSDGGTKNDADGDGYLADQDCDDNSASVNPGAAEACDGIDNNCNDVVDELVLAESWPDGDADGFGTGPSEPVCVGTPGYAKVSGDCDDADADVNPDAEERCDDIDRNCDDDPYLGASDFPTFFADSDADGFGNDASVQSTACVAPAGFTDQGGDCDDNNAARNPDADESCNGVDDDCDVDVDEMPIDGVTLYDDADLDSFGDPATGELRCAAVGLLADGTDCDDTDPAVNPAAAEVCNLGVDDDCDPATDEDVVAGTLWYADSDADGAGDLTGAVSACVQPAGTSALPGDCDDGDNTVQFGPPWFDDNDLDGYGDPTTELLACTQPMPGFVLLGDDCDDNNVLTYPGADELCDLEDNNCDLNVDENPIDPVTFYTDADGDLFGDAASPQIACAQPVGAVLDSNDCDDADPTSFPTNPEVCDGGIDNDCDLSTDEAFTALNYRDADGDGYGTDQDTVPGCSPPNGYVSVSGDCDDTDATINPVATPNCVQSHCGTISLSETWGASVTHRVTCDVVVEGAARPTLTVAAGAVVEFLPGSGLKVADIAEGRIRVVGTDLVPVRFTSSSTVKAPGQWDGLWILGRDTGSSLTHLLVDSAGQTGPINSLPGGVVFTGSDPVVDDLRSTGNLGAGLVINSGSEPLVVRSTFSDNTGNGVSVAVGGGLSRLDETGSQAPSFQDNSLTDNGARPITVTGSHADEIDLSNTLSPNTIDEIELLSGVLRFTGTWFDHGLPYVVATNSLIEVEDGPSAVLTIADDVEVYFNTGSELTVGVDEGGRLETGLNTLFTGTPAVIANSLNWRGLLIGANDLGSTIDDLEIAYGGANGKGNVWVNNSSPRLLRVLSRDSDNAGIYVSGTRAAPEIRDSLITGNDTDGAFVESTSGIARSSLGPTFTGNTVTGNGLSSVVLPPNYLGELDPSTTFTGNGDRIGVHGGTVADDAIWQKLDEDYEVRGDVIIGGPRDPIVDIDPEVIAYFDRDTSLQAGLNDDGVLRINGLVGSEVTLLSSDVAPGKGDWEGIVLSGASTPGLARHLLSNVIIQHAGGSDVMSGGAIEFVGRFGTCAPTQAVTLENVEILESTKAAFYARITSSIYIDGFTTDGSVDQGFFFDPGTPFDPCRYTITGPSGDAAEGIDLPPPVPTGCWPYDEIGDLGDPSHNLSVGPQVCANSIDEAVTWPDIGLPIVVTEMLPIDNSGSLTLEPGAVVQFEPDGGLECGTLTPGGLYATGATFTSLAPVPAPGDWQGLEFGSLCRVELVSNVVEYAGGNGTGAVTNPFSSCCTQPGDVFTVGSYLLDNEVSNSASCGLSGLENPDPLNDGIIDATMAAWPPYDPVATKALPAFGTTFAGNLGLDVCP